MNYGKVICISKFILNLIYFENSYYFDLSYNYKLLKKRNTNYYSIEFIIFVNNVSYANQVLSLI